MKYLITFLLSLFFSFNIFAQDIDSKYKIKEDSILYTIYITNDKKPKAYIIKSINDKQYKEYLSKHMTKDVLYLYRYKRARK